ncbi:unnamed protein product [Cuscuta epithymum]|uniref:Uncharacterized protein n=1 Tax=Cuscuta epithymum TaxID=186058 RepID=A0AAV0EPS7_9ASTE|nr:unnamed protein product [Cuscuta epithymum]
MDTNISSLERQISVLTSLIKEFISCSKSQDVHTCNICMSHRHLTDFCPELQKEYFEQRNDVGFQERYDSFSNTYNPYSSSYSSMSTEDMIRALTINVTNMQQNVSQCPQETMSNEQNLDNQAQQMPSIVNHMSEEEEEEENTEKAQLEEEPQNPTQPSAIPEIMSPFREALNETQRVEKDKDIYEIFRNCEYNLDFSLFTNKQGITVELHKYFILPLIPPESKPLPLTMLRENHGPSLSQYEAIQIRIFDPGKIVQIEGRKILYFYKSHPGENLKKMKYHDPSLND